MKKKWYNYFVVTEQPQGESEAPGVQRVKDVVPEADMDAPAIPPVADPTVFDDIYRSAKIAVPPHDYTVLKVADMLQSEHIRTLPADVKRKSILVALDAAGVKITDIVDDAVRRDRALDTYERVLQSSLEDLRKMKDAENRALQAELNDRMKEVRAQIEQNEREVSKEQDQLLAWRTRKRLEEDRIAEAVSYFVSENPVTRSAAPDDQGGSHNAG